MATRGGEGVAQYEKTSREKYKKNCAWRSGCLFDSGNTRFDSKDVREWFCDWHRYIISNDVNAMSKFEVFEEWVITLKKDYCTGFSHNSVQYLWDVVSGKHPQPEKPLRCYEHICYIVPKDLKKLEETKNTEDTFGKGKGDEQW